MLSGTDFFIVVAPHLWALFRLFRRLTSQAQSANGRTSPGKKEITGELYRAELKEL